MSFAKKYFFTLIAIIALIFLGRKTLGIGGSSQSLPLSSSTNFGVNSQPATPTATPAMALKDGTYTGQSADAYYGTIQVQIMVSGGKITNVNFPSYPNDNGRSQRISSQALPQLKNEVISAQSSQINAVSGASFTSAAFEKSLKSAINQASQS